MALLLGLRWGRGLGAVPRGWDNHIPIGWGVTRLFRWGCGFYLVPSMMGW